MTAPHRLDNPTLKEIISSTLRYWEPRRLVYNAVLAVVVVCHWIDARTDSETNYTHGSLWVLFLLAVGANLCYCAAWPLDVFIQQSDFRALWLRHRRLVFLAGTLTAAVLAHFTAGPFFRLPAGP